MRCPLLLGANKLISRPRAVQTCSSSQTTLDFYGLNWSSWLLQGQLWVLTEIWLWCRVAPTSQCHFFLAVGNASSGRKAQRSRITVSPCASSAHGCSTDKYTRAQSQVKLYSFKVTRDLLDKLCWGIVKHNWQDLNLWWVECL